MRKSKEGQQHMTFKYLKEIELSELDMDAVHHVLGKNAYEEPGFQKIFIPLNKEYGYEMETERISIEVLEKTIAKLKKAGANYMEIMHHSDHNGYVFYGIEVRKSTQEEIDEEKRKEIAKERIDKRLEELQSEFQKLQNERAKI